jgi:hypothetical protein
MTALTEADVRAFRRNGFLVVEDAVDAAVCERAREAVWAAVPEEPDDVAALRAAESPGNFGHQRAGRNELEETLPTAEPFEAMLDAVFPYAEALVGAGNLPEPGADLPETDCLHSTAVNPVVRYPAADTTWDDPNGSDANPPIEAELSPHVDGLGNETPSTLIVVVLFDRIYPRDGGFTLWPGSHRLVTDWLADNPTETIDPLPEAVAEATGPGFEVSGSAGTAVVAHNKTLHAAGPLYGDRPRMAAIANLSRTDIDEMGAEYTSDPWAYWDGVRDVEPRD